MLINFLNLVRSLFPSWNFFDEVGCRFQLEFKLDSKSDWTLVHFESVRTNLGLISNPEHNLALAKINIIEHFARDVQVTEKAEVENLDSFKMLCSLVQIHSKSTESYQFRLQALRQNFHFELYRSPTQKAQA